MRIREDAQLIGAKPKPSEHERMSSAALRTADALRQTALNPAIAQQDKPAMLMMALGWEEFARQVLVEVH